MGLCISCQTGGVVLMLCVLLSTPAYGHGYVQTDPFCQNNQDEIDELQEQMLDLHIMLPQKYPSIMWVRAQSKELRVQDDEQKETTKVLTETVAFLKVGLYIMAGLEAVSLIVIGTLGWLLKIKRR